MATGLTHLISHPVVLLSAAAIHQLPPLVDYAAVVAGVKRAAVLETGGNDILPSSAFDYGRGPSLTDRGATIGFFVAVGVALLLPIIIAVVYKKKVTDNRKPLEAVDNIAPQLQARNGFKFGLFDCFGDSSACLHGFFCGSVRIADTYSTGGVMQFWLVIFTPLIASLGVAVIAIIAQLIGSTGSNDYTYLVSVCIALIFARCRGQLRQRLGGVEAKFQDTFIDVLTWWCCGCCAIIQEARSVDAVQGVEVQCCCTLQQASASASPFLGASVPDESNAVLA